MRTHYPEGKGSAGGRSRRHGFWGGWVGFGVVALMVASGLRAAGEPGSAKRELPTAFLPGVRLPIVVHVSPGSGTAAYAVEESLPAGWTGTDVNEGGVFDALQGKVKWGVFADAAPRVLRYAVTPPPGSTNDVLFSGMVNLDGATSLPITGPRILTAGVLGEKAASRYLPAVFTPGQTVGITVLVRAGPSVAAYGIEEQPPRGWPITAVSEGGVLDGGTGKIKWGPFADSLSRVLTYRAAPPTDFQGTPNFRGRVNFDGSMEVEIATGNQTVVPNTAPVLAAVADQTIDERAPWNLTVAATDADLPANVLTFALVSGPPGLTVSTSGRLAWTPTEAQGPSTNTVVVKVTDNGEPALSATNQFTIVVREVNAAPVLAPIADQSAQTGVLFTLRAVATDGDLPLQTLRFDLPTAPADAAIDPMSGVFAWSPPTAATGTTNLIEVRVQDDGSPPLSATQRFTVTVARTEAEPPQFDVRALRVDAAGFHLRFAGTAGVRYRIERSEDLEVWEEVVALLSTGDPIDHADPLLTGRRARFYRVVSP